MRRNYERDLPRGYTMVEVIDAKDLKFGLILTLGALLLFAVALVPVFIPLFFGYKDAIFDAFLKSTDLIMLTYFGGTLLYMVLHELTHGAVYKSMTGEKLTFGISWNCAYCGVPNIYTYRKTALAALYAPFILFSVLFIPATALAFYFGVLWLYIALGLIFATHISGCIGDLYMGRLLRRKYTSVTTLINDNGPCVRVFTFDPSNIDSEDAATKRFADRLSGKYKY